MCYLFEYVCFFVFTPLQEKFVVNCYEFLNQKPVSHHSLMFFNLVLTFIYVYFHLRTFFKSLQPFCYDDSTFLLCCSCSHILLLSCFLFFYILIVCLFLWFINGLLGRIFLVWRFSLSVMLFLFPYLAPELLSFLYIPIVCLLLWFINGLLGRIFFRFLFFFFEDPTLLLLLHSLAAYFKLLFLFPTSFDSFLPFVFSFLFIAFFFWPFHSIVSSHIFPF